MIIGALQSAMAPLACTAAEGRRCRCQDPKRTRK